MKEKLIKALSYLKHEEGVFLGDDVFLCGKELDGSDKIYGFYRLGDEFFTVSRECPDGYPIRDMDKADLSYIFNGSKINGKTIYEKIKSNEYELEFYQDI